MILYELFNPTLTELRRNPEQNIKESGHKAAANFLKGKDLADFGVSMTQIPKLGINPGSSYNTPVGVYFYPAEYYMYVKTGFKGHEGKLDFQDDAPYIQIFEFNGNIEHIDRLNVNLYKAYISKLFANINKIAQLIGESEQNTQKMLSTAVLEAPHGANVGTYGGQLWYILYELSRSEGAQKRNNTAPRSAVIWNSLMRILGMDIVIDNGEGIIHKNEPNQGVAVNPRSIKLVKTIENSKGVNTEKTDTKKETIDYLAKIMNLDGYINKVVNAVNDYELTYLSNAKVQCKVIVDRCMSIFNAHPEYYTHLSIDNIKQILTLNVDASIKKDMIVGFYAAKFPKFKETMDAMLEDWLEVSSEPNFKNLTDERKKRAFVLSINPNKLHQSEYIIKELTPFKNDPRAKDMITYLTDVLQKARVN